MKRKIEIVFDMQDNKGNISFLMNGKVITALFGYDLKFNARTNEMKFTGHRLSTDDCGQYFVDDKGETATEEVDLLKYFSDEGTVREYIISAKKSVEFALKNIRDTSLFNARRMISNRLG